MSTLSFGNEPLVEGELKADSVSFLPAMAMPSFTVEVVVENKPLARDPEGETIHHNLILKGGFSQVTNVRAGKFLRLIVEAESSSEAERIVQKLCDDLRIYNPAAHVCHVKAVN